MSRDNNMLYIRGNSNLVSRLWTSLGLVYEIQRILKSKRSKEKTVALIKAALERKGML
jgi:hypothetical protein